MTQKTFIISDTHFNHSNIIKYCDRPFADADEMNEAMIANWNGLVRPVDKVYHLGDVYLPKKGAPNKDFDMLSRLNGTKVLILGNHDVGKDQILLKVFKRIYMWRLLKKEGLLLSHVPVHPGSIPYKSSLNVHGHIHNRQSPEGSYANACVEMHNYSPVPIEHFIAIAKTHAS